MTGREFAGYILPRYHFRKEAADLILARCDFELRDAMSLAGGGHVVFPASEDGRPLVVFETAQEEAAVHELAHAWWFLQRGVYVERLLIFFLRQAEARPGRYPLVRRLCRIYRYGDPETGFSGMWVGPPHNRWNHDEIFAGLASGTMGDMRLMPRDLRRIYGHMFRVPETVYLPAVAG